MEEGVNPSQGRCCNKRANLSPKGHPLKENFREGEVSAIVLSQKTVAYHKHENSSDPRECNGYFAIGMNVMYQKISCCIMNSIIQLFYFSRKG